MRRRSFLGAIGAGAALLAACRKDENAPAGAKVIDGWHIQNVDPMLSMFAERVTAFEAAHPGVKVNVTPLENEAFKAKLTTVTQAGNPPHIFSSWRGRAAPAGRSRPREGAAGDDPFPQRRRAERA